MMNSTRNIRPPSELKYANPRKFLRTELVSAPGLASRWNVADVGFVFHIGRRFARAGNIFRATALKNVLRALHFVGSVAMHGYQNSTLLKPPLITLRFIFRDAHSYESTCNSTNSTTNSCAC